jgi:Leucine-rich repeat (LRR) protein
MRKKSILLFVLSALVLVVICGFLIFLTNFAVINGNVYPLSVKTLDLKNSGIENLSVLNRFSKLESVCVYGSNAKSLPPLERCSSLNRLTVSGSDFPAEECVAFYDRHPDAKLECGVMIGGSRFSSLVRSLELSDPMNDGDVRLLAALKYLTRLDLSRSVVSDETYVYLKDKLPECNIIRTVVFDGSEYLNTAKSVKLSAGFFDSENAETEIGRLKYFDSLEEIDAFACADSDALMDLRKRFPQYAVRWKTQIFDKMFDTSSSEIDLSKKQHTLGEFVKAFDKKLDRFNNLKKVYMLDCGLTNLEMEKLMAKYPAVKFVWYVKFSRYKVRTDAVAFSTLISSHKDADALNEYTMAPLFKYCTDLVSLDVGHCHCRNISALANLKELRALIIMNNSVVDITPLGKLSKLEFLEMNGNYVRSVEPLGGLKNLKMINLYGSRSITDLSPLYSHKNLEMVIFDKNVPLKEQQRFIESNPDCNTSFKVPSEGRTTTVAWRASPLREKYKNSFRKWQHVTGFDEKTETFSYDFN